MPWFAGYCGVMVNVSDIAAMGGCLMEPRHAPGQRSIERHVRSILSLRRPGRRRAYQ
jgi:hypothetical protein